MEVFEVFSKAHSPKDTAFSGFAIEWKWFNCLGCLDEETLAGAEHACTVEYGGPCESITFDEAMKRDLKVMDATAFALCREQNLPIKVFNIRKKGSIARVCRGEDEGTLVYNP